MSPIVLVLNLIILVVSAYISLVSVRSLRRQYDDGTMSTLLVAASWWPTVVWSSGLLHGTALFVVKIMWLVVITGGWAFMISDWTNRYRAWRARRDEE